MNEKDKKEEALRKKAKSNLEPKGWEALLEGVSSIDEEEMRDLPEKASEEPARPEEHLLKITDESGEVSEKVTFGGESRDAEAFDMHAVQTQEEPLEEGPIGSPATPPSPSSSEAAAPSAQEENKGKKSFEQVRAWIEKQPAAQRILQYYQGLNPRDQKIILGVLCFASVLILYTFSVSPMLEKNELLNRKITKKSEELSEMIRLRSSVVQDRGGMDRIKRIVEERGRDFSVFAYLEQLATKAEMKDKIIYIKPQREAPVGSFRESLAEIKVDKIDIDGLTRFLYQIESSEDLLYIKNLKMKTVRKGKEQEGLEATLSVGTLTQ
jgi:general secretion pathway protein M